ncbi:ATP-binding protein [Streptomyces sp. TX20-6-3]|uniref:ATP-binding protein n=1 Tax=Streptomyces sp. TX20-6-3 TaxID=3028705 RepID=UPI0029A52707|nr:ATP-binding protein [Streptomyces sp. TX20-6-3]MDX2565443.1 ATP-binding protein [Streptomyces sp. TX20-6-3]
MTMTMVSRKGQQCSALSAVPDGGRGFVLPLEHGPLAPATARHAVRPVLASWGLDADRVYDTLLVVSELVTNAVTHALPPVVLHLRGSADGSGGVQVHVTDGGPRTEAGHGNWAATRPEDEHGRGGQIITALASHTGTATEADLYGLIDHWAGLDAA